MDQLAQSTTELTVALLIHYSFDLGGDSASGLVNRWRGNYQDNWVLAAVIEALYRGRYKAISVEQILAVWQRRGVALNHFNHEFERLVCSNFPQVLTAQSSSQVNAAALSAQSIMSAKIANRTHVLVETGVGHQTLSNNVPQISSKPQSLQQWHQNSAPLPSIIRPPIQQFSPAAGAADERHKLSKLKAIARCFAVPEAD